MIFIRKSLFSLIVILAVCLSVFVSFTPKVLAQAGGGQGSVNAGSNGWFNVGGIAGTAVSCLSSSGLLQGGLQSIGSALGIGGGSGNSDQSGGGIGDGATGSVIGQEVPVRDANVRKEAERIKQEEEKNTKKEYCLDKIAKDAVTRVMDKMTLAMVDWINNGFEGDPFFVSNPGEFLANVAVGEIDGFMNFYANPNVAGDFFHAVAEAIYANLQRSTYQRFQNSLALVLAHGTPEEFRFQFNVGGWAGYSALFQPQNNPFGSYLLASDEIGKRVTGSSYTRIQNLNKQLDLSGGFFDQQVCSLTATGNPSDEYISKEDSRYYPNRNQPPPVALLTFLGIDPYAVGPLTQQQEDLLDQYSLMSNCVKWRTQTPGYVIANQLTDTLGSPLRQLELADEFQENLALIMDALFNQLINGDNNVGGLLGLNPQENSDPNTNPLIGQVQGLYPGQQANQTPLPGAINGNGTAADPGIVQVQLDYIAQAPINIAKIAEVLVHIRALDYCVPGPNPKWYNSSVQQLQTVLQNPPFASTGTASGDQAFYADEIENITGINISPQSAITTQTDFLDFLIYTFSAYRDAVYATYSPNQVPPSMRPALVTLFNQIDTLVANAGEYQTNIDNINAVLPQLLDIQNQINALPQSVQNDPNSPQMQALTQAFASIANAGLVNQNQLNALFSQMSLYDYYETQSDQRLADCLTETGPGYGNPSERVQYPFDLSSHPSAGILPPPQNSFIGNQSFGDSFGEINLSGFHNANINVPTTPVQTFQNFLGVY